MSKKHSSQHQQKHHWSQNDRAFSQEKVAEGNTLVKGMFRVSDLLKKLSIHVYPLSTMFEYLYVVPSIPAYKRGQ
jgi:hypothetical protein